MKRTYKFKLYNSKRLRKIERLLHIACSVYNHCIALEKQYYRLFGKNVNQYELVNHITKMKKKQRFGFWKELNSQVIQDTVERVCRNYRSFFGSHKKNKRAQTPRFVSKYRYKSITYKQSGYKFDGNVLMLQKQWKITLLLLSLEMMNYIVLLLFPMSRDHFQPLFQSCTVAISSVPSALFLMFAEGN